MNAFEKKRLASSTRSDNKLPSWRRQLVVHVASPHMSGGFTHLKPFCTHVRGRREETVSQTLSALVHRSSLQLIPTFNLQQTFVNESESPRMARFLSLSKFQAIVVIGMCLTFGVRGQGKVFTSRRVNSQSRPACLRKHSVATHLSAVALACGNR